MKSKKYHYRVLMTIFVLDDGIDTLAYFTKQLQK